MTFQNCKFDTPEDPQKKKRSLGELSYKIGDIVQIDPANGTSIEDKALPTHSDIIFKFLNIDPVSDNYKWTVKRGFDSIVTDAPTEIDTYKTQFSDLGSHDVFAKAYKSTDLKTKASKKFVVGESCSLSDILEIVLLSTSSSLKVGDSGFVTFGLKNSEDFSSIKWRTTLPSGRVITNEDVDTLEIDLSSQNAGSLVIEVSATGSDASKSECLTYRKQEINVTSNLSPYFNPINLTDSRNNIPVILENNDIYKYRRPDSIHYLQVEVLNAETCQYQINQRNKTDFSCDSEPIPISSSSGTDCIETTVHIFASNSQGGEHSRSYYHHCPKNDNYCYFGLMNAKQGHHVCPVERLSPLNTDPIRGSCGNALDTCQTGDFKDVSDTQTHYKWQCVGISGGSTDDCQEVISSSNQPPSSCPSGQYYSRTVCENISPDNSTCQLQNDGCYAWSCNDDYTQSGNSCDNIARDSFQVRQSLVDPQVDILVVIDTSGSMSHHQKKLGDRFNDLISGLSNTNIDWQVAFINADGTNKGRFYNLENETGEISVNGQKVNILNPELLDRLSGSNTNNLQKIFYNTIDRSDELVGSSNEMPLGNIKNAISRRNAQNSGFFRDSATLATIILSNEDELSDGKPKGGINPTTPLEIIQAISDAFGADKRLISYGIIIIPGDTGCFDVEGVGVYSTFIDELSTKTYSICQRSYSGILQNISSHIEATLTLSHIPFRFSNVIESSITLTFTPPGNAQTGRFDASSNTYIFDEKPADGTTILVEYKYKRFMTP